MSTKKATPHTEAHKWEFKVRFRRNAFGWRSEPAILRIQQAIAEIKKVAKQDPLLAALGAITFLERVSPALDQIDSSSGAIGAAVNNAIDELVPVIVNAPADAKTRDAWLERLFKAYEADKMPFLEHLADRWGELCVSKEVASSWANKLLGMTRMALHQDKTLRRGFRGISACLSALYHAERFDEIIDLLRVDTIWPYQHWAVRAFVACGKPKEALSYAESCQNPQWRHPHIDLVCEGLLLSSGMVNDAYARYGIHANQRRTYLATFRAILKKYPHKEPSDVLFDLVQSTPGNEGKWFAAAKDAGLYDEAIALANRAPCDPKTLTRAARDYAEKQPAFAVEAGMLALYWLMQGHGYEITSADVWEAYHTTLAAAARYGNAAEVTTRIRQLLATEGAGKRLVTQALAQPHK